MLHFTVCAIQFRWPPATLFNTETKHFTESDGFLTGFDLMENGCERSVIINKLATRWPAATQPPSHTITIKPN